ncbi:hypothetical protein MLD38_014370 [Melastoma candidum]|uniref:Uncharacterized protein n=1 Tax=Melastoma candidum TaxID=119954 RepID=A0ACB9RDQ9_9MYRT|nr:hypothetical protein MLD38_014370 [Melastoma candidum]
MPLMDWLFSLVDEILMGETDQGRDMESGVTIGCQRQDAAANVEEPSWFGQFRNGANPWMARYMYALMFLASNLVAWAVRDYGQIALKDLEKLKGCHGEGECLGAEGVLRVSFGCFMFFIIMFFSTIRTSKMGVRQDKWHSGWWSFKILLLVSLTIIPFVVPSVFIDIYGEVARFGAGVFLLIQLISIITFIKWLNNCCQSDKNAERCHIHVMLIATTAYVVCILGVILMYIWYAPEPSCVLNIFFITWTVVLLQLMTSISLHPKVNAGLLNPGLMGLYIAYICWSAIRSEPAGTRCNRKAESSHHTDWLSIISFFIALLAIVFATFSTGIDSECFQLRKKEARGKDDIPYGYGFFHFVFAMGAMYFSMLLISWNSHHPLKRWTIDVGWTSTWVRIVDEWVAVCLFIWMLVRQIVWKSRHASATA